MGATIANLVIAREFFCESSFITIVRVLHVALSCSFREGALQNPNLSRDYISWPGFIAMTITLIHLMSSGVESADPARSGQRQNAAYQGVYCRSR